MLRKIEATRASSTVSIVTPFYNEEQCVKEYYDRVTTVMQESGREYEIIAVSDGSTDSTDQILTELMHQDHHVRVFRLSRNTGQWAAISAGLSATRGDYVIVMDGDLQHAPTEIPLLVEKLEEGYDLVSGSRKGRTENLMLRRLPSLIANMWLRGVTGCSVRDMGGFKGLRGDIARSLRLRAGQHRLLPALVFLQGGRVGEVSVSAPARFAGSSKYNLRRSGEVILDVIMLWFQRSLGSRPMYAIGRISMALFLLSALCLTWTLWDKLMNGIPLLDRPAFFAGLSLLIISVILLFVGFMIDFLSDIWSRQTKQLPYIVRELPGLQDSRESISQNLSKV